MTKEEIYKAYALHELPTHMQEGMCRYIQRGILPGGFATAVLENNLVDAFARADATNTHAMRAWASWLYNRAPRGCWGSPKAVDEWSEQGGLAGLEAKIASAPEWTGADTWSDPKEES